MVKLTKKQRVENIRHNRKFGIINEDKAISYGGKTILKKASLDDYDTQGYEDNQHDIDFGLDNYNKED